MSCINSSSHFSGWSDMISDFKVKLHDIFLTCQSGVLAHLQECLTLADFLPYAQKPSIGHTCREAPLTFSMLPLFEAGASFL